jgi:hypothetical protein
MPIDTPIPTLFPMLSFCLLGIERLLYGYIYHFPSHFKASCKSGKFGSGIQQIPEYWKCMMTLGAYIKVFQFSVIVYDLSMLRQGSLVASVIWQGGYDNDTTTSSIMYAISYPRILLGLLLIGMGQVLNLAVFRALGGIGVYYGHELGYKVPFLHCFPYNTGISDPQYWGVVLCIWGIYVLCGIPGATSWIVPFQELFWYGMSMKLIEHNNGKRLLVEMGIKQMKKVE